VSHRPATWDPLRAPVNVTWEITSKCNLQCRHCLSADMGKTDAAELDFEQCRAFIDELDRMEVFQINFGGGEPFLRKDFCDILDYAHLKGIITCVSTNGTLLNANLVKRLSGMKLLRIQVSLDGATAATNDAIRGAGTYERILEGIALLCKQRFPNLSINTVVTRPNFSEIEQLCELASHYEVNTRLSRFRPSGDAKCVWQEFRLDHSQLAWLSEFLSAHREILTGDSFFSITKEDRRELGLNICGAARMTCSVLPNGSVYPCAFLCDEPFRGGNILHESLRDIWLHSAAFNAIRAIRVEACENCERFSLCHGGCPAVAYFLAKSLNHPDPECIASFQREAPHHAGTV
jgi:mycofactocin biosynthetic radical S-adenosylmethionine protein MftC